MSKTVKSSIDLKSIGVSVAKGAQDGMRKAMEHLLTEANKHVPHDEGTLERSGTSGVMPASGYMRTGFVAYDTPYAVRQHEDMSLRHDGKGQAKWLESTMGQEAQTLGQIMAAEIRRQAGT